MVNINSMSKIDIKVQLCYKDYNRDKYPSRVLDTMTRKQLLELYHNSPTSKGY